MRISVWPTAISAQVLYDSLPAPSAVSRQLRAGTMFPCCCSGVVDSGGHSIEPVTELSKPIVIDEKDLRALAADAAEEPQGKASGGFEEGAAPEPQCTLVFRDGSGETSCVFKRSPLGFRFRPTAPIVVTTLSPGGEAEAVGVRPGMLLVSVDGEAVDAKPYTHLFAQLRAVASALPNA